ncbi:methionine adenosyltransferase [Haloarcula litorea]|uniref:methionine adenosyltransferase n=1 Tax=Haloarcula litorea TaxID=3032579 RepID=UPI0023E8C237|nr:methionine adenosyltransferase [Halomicroarcula sp. GDY20]
MDDRLSVEPVEADPVETRAMEFVERKGVGHPDSLCDGVAEAVSRRLSAYYRDEFGEVLHHNTDKVHLGAGQSEPAFGGGTVTRPIYVLVGGRATTAVDGERVPVDAIASEAARDYLLGTVPSLSSEHVDVETRIGETSADLGALFRRGAAPLANDTSFGVGHAPGTPTERYVRTLAPRLHSELDAVGKDVKLMALRRGEHVSLTVAAAVVDEHVEDLAAYRAVVGEIEALAKRHAAGRIEGSVSVRVNAADDPETGSVYLTTTGLSAESGDDGAVGRGNRANGLITPGRPMSLEATAGKNPITHVGKLYNLLALRIARRLAETLGASHGGVQLLSRIGEPVAEPWAVDVQTTVADADAVADAVAAEFDAIGTLRADLLAGRVDVF